MIALMAAAVCASANFSQKEDLGPLYHFTVMGVKVDQAFSSGVQDRGDHLTIDPFVTKFNTKGMVWKKVVSWEDGPILGNINFTRVTVQAGSKTRDGGLATGDEYPLAFSRIPFSEMKYVTPGLPKRLGTQRLKEDEGAVYCLIPYRAIGVPPEGHKSALRIYLDQLIKKAFKSSSAGFQQAIEGLTDPVWPNKYTQESLRRFEWVPGPNDLQWDHPYGVVSDGKLSQYTPIAAVFTRKLIEQSFAGEIPVVQNKNFGLASPGIFYFRFRDTAPPHAGVTLFLKVQREDK